MKKRSILFFLIGFLLFCYLLNFSFWNTLKSYTVMFFYDQVMSKKSTLHEKNIDFDIPGGIKTLQSDWYPWMLPFNASQSFSQYMNEDLSLDILYSFGDFEFLKGSSTFYNARSPYYGAFYGGYAVFTKDASRRYGFYQDNQINMDEIQRVPMFDQTQLVLPSVGCPTDRIEFHTKIKEIQPVREYAGHKDWIRIDVEILTNAPIHHKTNPPQMGYIQYGKPHPTVYSGFDYPVTPFHGRTYVKYIEELGGTFFLYVMAQEKNTIYKCDQNFLSYAKIHKK